MKLEMGSRQKLDEAFEDIAKRRERYQKMTQGSILEDIIEKLDEIGYFACPAGKKHHGSHIGGLFDHSLAVADKLIELTEQMGLEWERHESPVIIGLLHDICKTQQYDVIADPDKCYRIEWNHRNILAGHGELSHFMACELMELTKEEQMCIRYHMGAYEGQHVWNTMGAAIKEYPNILYVQLADMYASKVDGI